MSTHSLAEAKDKLPELIDRALEGEAVVITRDGHAVAELKPIRPSPTPRPITEADLDWLAARRIKRIKVSEDAGTLVSRMRDEGEH
jgi:antitoxin (DNA-binding transcriptional repressor) of toxin-antitoxin stability system